MIGLIVNALIAVGIALWIAGSTEATVPTVTLFVVLFTTFEVGSIHRKIDKLK